MSKMEGSKAENLKFDGLHVENVRQLEKCQSKSSSEFGKITFI